MCKKYLSLLMILLLLFTSAEFVFAESKNDMRFNNDLSETLAPYLTDEFSAYTAGSDSQPLYTTSNNQFGYFVPIFENDTPAGYAVMLANSNQYELLALEISSEKAQIADRLMSLNSNSKIIFDFPFTFIVSENKDKNYEVNSLTNKIQSLSHEEFQNISIDKPSSSLDAYIESKNKSVMSASAVPPTYNLTKWKTGEFVPVDGRYYGGYQEWLNTELSGDRKVSTFWSNRSCGVAAAANVAAYLSYNKSGKSNLYNKGELTKYNYTNNMRDIYDYISPAIWGIPTIGNLKNGMESFARSRGVPLTGYISEDKWNKSNALSYIGQGLSSDSPVLMLTWNSSVPDLQNHWVTITKSYYFNTNNYIATSNWGAKAVYNFDTWFDGGSLYQGIIYFK